MMAGLDVSGEPSDEFEFMTILQVGKKIYLHICKDYCGGETGKLLIKSCLQF